MSDCIFCKISSGEIPNTPIYEDELIYAFDDLSPQAPVHFLVVPKCHVESMDALSEEHERYVARIMTKIKDIAKLKGLENGYRVIVNCGDDGGQTVKHLHFHVLGGRSLQWPPG